VASSQQAATALSMSREAADVQMQLSQDQVAALGIQAAAAQAMNANNNAAAVSVATLEAGVAQKTIDASLAAQTNNNATQITLGQQITQTEALKTIAGIIPKTQAQSLAKGQQTDAAGYGLMEMFRNLLNINQGVKATTTLLTATGAGTTATVYGADGKAGDTTYVATRQDGGFYTGKAEIGGSYSLVKGTSDGIRKDGKTVPPKKTTSKKPLPGMGKYTPSVRPS